MRPAKSQYAVGTCARCGRVVPESEWRCECGAEFLWKKPRPLLERLVADLFQGSVAASIPGSVAGLLWLGYANFDSWALRLSVLLYVGAAAAIEVCLMRLLYRLRLSEEDWLGYVLGTLALVWPVTAAGDSFVLFASGDSVGSWLRTWAIVSLALFVPAFAAYDQMFRNRGGR